MQKQTPRLAVLFAFLFATIALYATPPGWVPYGPNGGDARSIAADPHDKAHLYLGTANGWIYESHNAGTDWKRLARIGNRDDLVLDSIVIDPVKPNRIVVGTWVLSSPDGGIFISDDAGLTWTANSQMKGQSIRALSIAPSDPTMLVAGTLKGVYQSNDSGLSWKLITPAGSKELHEVESIAIDPKDTKTIYAGTWHLAWKTTDGGANWANIKEGVIDDSDVFSIIIDQQSPNVVYLSACSGIYKSDTAAARFQKIQGIPSTARRTRVLMQDPSHENIVFAGTTEGLYRTTDSGKTWSRTSGPELIVNDIYINPTDSKNMMLATDRGGVLISNDGGNSFRPTNNGFTSRLITSYAEDSRQPNTIYVGMVNDKAWGGVFVSSNGGVNWTQKNAGLEKEDIFSLSQAPDGTMLAGTRHGIYRLNGSVWSKVSQVSLELPVAAAPTAPTTAKKGTRRTPVKAPAKKAPTKVFDGTVFAFTHDGDRLFAATSAGILASGDSGRSWTLAADPQGHVWYTIASHGPLVLASSLSTPLLSPDNGKTWNRIAPPAELTQITAVAVDGFGGLWMGGREGIYASDDKGASWHTVPNFFMRDVNSIYYDEHGERILFTANASTTLAFAAHLPDKKVSYWNTGWNLRLVRPLGDHFVAATLYDGIVVQPEMVNAAEAGAH